ncbi:unnamed protein product [Somion occarium]
MADSTQNLFTCLSCSIAFYLADDQRVHYRSDHHRYNMKRRVAGLSPVSVEIFSQRVLERQSETAVAASSKFSSCTVCGKTYTTENAYRSHMSSKKHKENEQKAAKRASEPRKEPTPPATVEEPAPERPAPSIGISLTVAPNATEEEIIQTIDEKIAAARARLSPSHCLFCLSASSSTEENLAHMSAAHSFFLPDTEYLVDLSGLLTYLGEKIAVGNVCIYCGAEFRTLDAVRRHMLDKGHCKIAYDTDLERLEVSDFYDFSTSYPDAEKRTKAQRKKETHGEDENEEWEDVEDDGEEADEVIEVAEGDEDADLDEYAARLGDTPYELILPSGSRVAHRHIHGHHRTSHVVALRRTRPGEDASTVAENRRLLRDKGNMLVPRNGGFGAYASGMDLVKARNPGEAREAGRHVKEFRDQQRREHFKTKVGFRHNYQKHFRDPLLQ